LGKPVFNCALAAEFAIPQGKTAGKFPKPLIPSALIEFYAL
jgi:hypothetical protein